MLLIIISLPSISMPASSGSRSNSNGMSSSSGDTGRRRYFLYMASITFFWIMTPDYYNIDVRTTNSMCRTGHPQYITDIHMTAMRISLPWLQLKWHSNRSKTCQKMWRTMILQPHLQYRTHGNSNCCTKNRIFEDNPKQCNNVRIITDAGDGTAAHPLHLQFRRQFPSSFNKH